MIRHAMVERGLGFGDGFRLRGREVSRVEGFSDAAFAFAITLLVVSLEAPRDYAGLLDVMRGVPAFAVCFATVAWVWAAHYKFFRRFGLQDRLTVVLNAALLFVVMLYVYPLKFMFTEFLAMVTGLRPGGGGSGLRLEQVGPMFVIYGLGFAAVFALLGLLNARAYALREPLGLDAAERLATRQEIARCAWLTGIGLLSVAAAVALPGRLAGAAGMVYSLIAAVEYGVGSYFGRRIRRLVATPAAE